MYIGYTKVHFAIWRDNMFSYQLRVFVAAKCLVRISSSEKYYYSGSQFDLANAEDRAVGTRPFGLFTNFKSYEYTVIHIMCIIWYMK